MMEQRKNINRGYMLLRVWQDARELYILTWSVVKHFPYELKRIASQQIASGSAGESVSALHVYCPAGHITESQFGEMDALAYKLENGLKKLIESLQSKQATNDWDDSFIVKESNKLYKTSTGL
jgi:hypothetical protein